MKNSSEDLLQQCTHPVPENQHGVFAMHCMDNQPLPSDITLALINGPLAAMQSDLRNQLKRDDVEAE